MVKLDLFTGFLGAGKTTFIWRYIAWMKKQGIRAAIVENEFGVAGMDTAILKACGITTMDLTGSCICCGLKANFYDMLRDLAQSGKYDRIVIEPSGIFNLDDYLEVVDSLLPLGTVTYGTVTAIVDPAMFSVADDWMAELLFMQLHSASHIVVSKLRTSTPEQTEQYQKWIQEIYDKNNCQRPAQQKILAEPWKYLTAEQMADIAAGAPLSCLHPHKHYHHEHLFQSTTLCLSLPYDVQTLEEKLKLLFTGCYGDIMRIKGFVQLESGATTVLLNCTPDNMQITSVSEPSPMAINIIGRNLQHYEMQTCFSV